MLLKRQIEDLEKGLKTSMLSRLLTALSLISLILVVLYLQSAWLFTILICFVCILALYEWIANNFKNKLFGFFLIFNFGFWSILSLCYVVLGCTLPLFCGVCCFCCHCFPGRCVRCYRG